MKHAEAVSNIVSNDGIIDVITKNGRAGALTPDSPDLTTAKEWLMTSLPKTRQSIAIEFLQLARTHVEKADNLRTYYACLARDYGLSHQAIGDELGISEARVRQIIKAGRNGTR